MVIRCNPTVDFNVALIARAKHKTMAMLMMLYILQNPPEYPNSHKHVIEFMNKQQPPPPPRSGHRNCRNVPERFAGTL